MAKNNTQMLNGGERAINRLILLSVETGCVTAVSAIIELGLFLGPATKNTNLHLFLYVFYSSHVPKSTVVLTPVGSRFEQRSHLRQEYVPPVLRHAS